MKVFILEDDNRRMWMLEDLKILPNAEITRAESCGDVKKFQPPYDLILLDHDLGGRQMTANEDDGYQFVKLVKDKIPHGVTVIVHSYNPDGAKRMIAALLDGEPELDVSYAPFMGTTFVDKIKDFRERYYAGKLGNHLE